MPRRVGRERGRRGRKEDWEEGRTRGKGETETKRKRVKMEEEKNRKGKMGGAIKK